MISFQYLFFLHTALRRLAPLLKAKGTSLQVSDVYHDQHSEYFWSGTNSTLNEFSFAVYAFQNQK